MIMENSPSPNIPNSEPSLKKLKMSSAATTDSEDAAPLDSLSKKNPRYKRRKIAIFMGYCGVGYQGMQKNPGAKTIEGDLEEALYLAGAISEPDRANPKRYDWARAARTDKGVSAISQVVSGRFYVDPPGLVDRLNSHLPPQIRIFGYKRATNSFNAKKYCDRRRYLYLLPVFALDPSSHRDRESVIASAGLENELVKCMECSERGRKVVGIMGRRNSEISASDDDQNSNSLCALMGNVDKLSNDENGLRVAKGFQSKDNMDEHGIVTASALQSKIEAANSLKGEDMLIADHLEFTCSESTLKDKRQNRASLVLQDEHSSVQVAVQQYASAQNRSSTMEIENCANGSKFVDNEDTNIQMAVDIERNKVEKNVEESPGFLQLSSAPIGTNANCTVSYTEAETHDQQISQSRCTHEDNTIRHQPRFQYGEKERERFNQVLGQYVGTHNFHNFTTRIKADDPAAHRYIISCTAGPCIAIQGMDLIPCEVVGQSFMLHQIRKMIGLAVAIMRHCAAESVLQMALRREVNVNVPTAPELGLFLDECLFDSYNKRWEESHELLSMSSYAEEAEKFKLEHVYTHIASTERREGTVALWLHSLNHRNYPDMQGLDSTISTTQVKAAEPDGSMEE